MNIGILTHYDVNNQGAQLQMYALSKKIEELGHKAIILTYNKNYDFDLEKKLRFNASIKSIPYYVKNYLIKSGVEATYKNYRKLKLNKQFRKENFEFQNYATANIDCAVVGSDEVFSIPMGVNMMMYGHCLSTSKVFSYAPSFGQTTTNDLKKHNCYDLVKCGLNNFVNLSARDVNSFEIIKELTNKNPEMVCDPVLLYDFSKTKTDFKIPQQKYMVIYAYDFNITSQQEVESIKRYAKEQGLITVSPGTYHKWCDKNISCNALEWIEVFRNAECVVTDTFHGTITATISNRPMAVLVRDKLNSNKMFDLIEKLGLNDRRLNEISYEELSRVFSNEIDFGCVNNNITKLRQNAERYLVESIEKCK